jgi:hypothetical protein
MAQINKTVNELARQKQDLIRKLDKDSDNQDLKDELRRVNDKIRYWSKKEADEIETTVSNAISREDEVVKSNSIKKICLTAFQRGDSVDAILKANPSLKRASLLWYASKLGFSRKRKSN